MSRTSRDQYDHTGRLLNGYDYTNQAWVIDGLYVKCGHPESMKPGCCFAGTHAGEPARMTDQQKKHAASDTITKESAFGEGWDLHARGGKL